MKDLRPTNDAVRSNFARICPDQGELPEEFFSLVHTKGQAALQAEPIYRLCHGDFQQDNMLIIPSAEVTLIDWDYPAWSPVERDLMFIAPEYRAKFERGYGPIQMNEPVLDYLTANWVLQEALDFADRILFKTTLAMDEASWALASLASLLPRMKAAIQASTGWVAEDRLS